MLELYFSNFFIKFILKNDLEARYGCSWSHHFLSFIILLPHLCMFIFCRAVLISFNLHPKKKTSSQVITFQIYFSSCVPASHPLIPRQKKRIQKEKNRVDSIYVAVHVLKSKLNQTGVFHVTRDRPLDIKLNDGSSSPSGLGRFVHIRLRNWTPTPHI